MTFSEVIEVRRKTEAVSKYLNERLAGYVETLRPLFVPDRQHPENSQAENLTCKVPIEPSLKYSRNIANSRPSRLISPSNSILIGCHWSAVASICNAGPTHTPSKPIYQSGYNYLSEPLDLDLPFQFHRRPNGRGYGQ